MRVRPALVELWSRTDHYWSQIRAGLIQATIQNVSADRYLSLQVPDVRVHVQDELVNALVDAQTNIREVIDRLDRQIALLQEHRQALITAAVTGELEIAA